jgi:excisionase family DNA binding protein
VAQVAQLLNYGESKVRMLIITGQLRSIKDGPSRRILPEWVEAYVHVCHVARRPRCDPRVIMRILRHADQAVTMEIYANASSAATQEALRRLGETLH